MRAGVLLCASGAEARARLSAAFAGDSDPHSSVVDGAVRGVEKQYLALVDGWPAADAGVVETPIGRVQYGVLGGLHAASPTGKPCESWWSVVRRNPDGTSVLAVTIRTGGPQSQVRASLGLSSGFEVSRELCPSTLRAMLGCRGQGPC